MNQNIKFIFGLVVGFLICYFAVKNNSSEKISQSSLYAIEDTSVEKTVKTQPTIHRAGKMDLPQDEAIKAPKATPIELQATMTMVDKMPVEALKKKKTIQFSLQDIITMESQWQDLHQQIQVNKEERGWRVKMLAQNTVFSSAGLTQGNLITYDSIRALGDSENSNLPYRISIILNHVTVQ